MKPSYDKTSIESIYLHGDKLTGRSLSQVVALPVSISDMRNKGGLGSLIEKYLYEHVPPNTQLPDFPDAGLELKTTGVVKDKKSGGFREKERLSLTQINYIELRNEEWSTSKLLNKCNLILLLFYEYKKEIVEVDRRFVLPPLLFQFTADARTETLQANNRIRFLKLPDPDIAQIRRDWEKIRAIVRENRAHELSEGDTFYLAASRKGSGGPNETLRRQADSEELAKSRAFALKPTYLRQLINAHFQSKDNLGMSGLESFEQALKSRLNPYFGMTVSEMSKKLNFEMKSKNHKNFYRGLINKAITSGENYVIEHEKADVELKTLRVSARGKPKESMSFPTFRPLEIINQSWEESDFCRRINKKFLFAVFEEGDEGSLVFKTAFYWNMPFQDRVEARKVWEETKRRVAHNIRPYPRKSESSVAHVRPHAANRKDVYQTPQGHFEMKHGFWLNSEYIEKVIKELT